MSARVVIGSSAILGIIAMAGWSAFAFAESPKSQPGEVAVTLTGGHDTNPVDHGRPVILVASALGVPEDVFREAFSHVRPARGGSGPSREEAQKNKHELLSRLEKYGVTNERLDEVSNFYRYRPQEGELWKHKEAIVFATMKDGQVTGFRIADAGYGYSSPPSITVPGASTAAVAKVKFDKDLMKNGSIESISQGEPTTKP